MAHRVHLDLGPRSHEVVIGEDLDAELLHVLARLKPSAILLVSDENVFAAQGEPLLRLLSQAAPARHSVVAAGEDSKSLGVLGRVLDEALAPPTLDRQALVVALGGGVVGDLAGFVAATLLRGVRWLQLPTSLLAMVDAGVGGKTALNHAAGKNLIGAFWQPACVLCDLRRLASLPAREFRSALPEIIKTALLAGEDDFSRLEAEFPALLAADRAVLEAVVARCVAHKARVVERDELETLGERATLNLGHSLGHVLENRFPNRYLHGEAVGVGLLAALRVSQAHTGCPPELAARVRALLEAAGLATDPPEDLHAAELLRVLGSDKKRESGVLRFVALSRPGSARLVSLALDAALAGLLLGRT